jgi:membrane protease YdiL (CAAX protease family)
LGLLAAAAGFFGMIFLVIFYYMGHLRRGLETGIRYGGLYAETFAVWMALFLGLEFVVGIFGGEKYWFEFLGLGMLMMAVFSVFNIGLWPINPDDYFGPVEQRSHPVMEDLLTGNWLRIVQVIVIAAIVAPIVEETMFRGVLYRHLREASARWGVTASVVVSGLLVSFVFAVIHPQGWIAVPALMALAFGFTLLREWRGTLIPSMVAHGINNGMLTVVLILAAG